MASADNPLADLTNLNVYSNLMNPNPYTPYQGILPMPSYSLNAGAPTNAQGQPISSFQGPSATSPQTQPGTTLNTSPVSQPAAGGGRQSYQQVMNAAQGAGSLYAVDPSRLGNHLTRKKAGRNARRRSFLRSTCADGQSGARRWAAAGSATTRWETTTQSGN